VDRKERIERVRRQLRAGQASVGSWMQIPHPSIAEILGSAGYDWVTLDLEHGAIGIQELPDLCRALELGETLPLVRIAEAAARDCKMALDAGAGGVIVPQVESATQLNRIAEACRWPPAGRRGVGFSRANLFGQRFAAYREEAQAPLLVGMIESAQALSDLDAIMRVPGLDAVFVGPYDLSASLGATGDFTSPAFVEALARVRTQADRHGVASGIHVVSADPQELRTRVREGYRFLAYSLDAVFLSSAALRPDVEG
jgi:2-dehydro-3-deoxyglucarate aldolase